MTAADAGQWLMHHSRPTGLKDLVYRSREIIHPRAGNDDRIPAPVRFLGDSEKSSAIIFTKFHVETLPFDLELFCLDDAVHLPKNGAV
jgi:hypothetical protein